MYVTVEGVSGKKLEESKGKKKRYEYCSGERYFPDLCPVIERLSVSNILTVVGHGLQSFNRPRRRRSENAVLSGEALPRSSCCRRQASPEW